MVNSCILFIFLFSISPLLGPQRPFKLVTTGIDLKKQKRRKGNVFHIWSHWAYYHVRVSLEKTRNTNPNPIVSITYLHTAISVPNTSELSNFYLTVVNSSSTIYHNNIISRVCQNKTSISSHQSLVMVLIYI